MAAPAGCSLLDSLLISDLGEVPTAQNLAALALPPH
jgi:hypothetical protein